MNGIAVKPRAVMRMEMNVKKITLATIKAFVRKNEDSLYIMKKSSFDGMVDGVRACEDRAFRPVENEAHHEATMGIKGAWFVRGSRDYFNEYDDGKFKGYEVSNCCGSFILAINTGGI